MSNFIDFLLSRRLTRMLTAITITSLGFALLGTIVHVIYLSIRWLETTYEIIPVVAYVGILALLIFVVTIFWIYEEL